MAWVKIKGSNEKYQYGNTAPGRSTYKNSARGDNSVITDGILSLIHISEPTRPY